MKFALLLFCAIGLVFAVLPNADAAVDMFLKIDGVQGESLDSKHKGEIDVLAWSWGMSNPGTGHVGGGGGAGKVNVQDLSFTKYVDKSSPILLLHAANGEHFEKATLVVRKAGETPVEFKKIILENILVTSVSLGGSGGEDRLTENVSLNFQKVRTEYKSFDGKDTGTTSFEWDILTNTGGDGSDTDSDGDGIADSIDTNPNEPTFDFSDGISGGTILTGAQFLTITDVPGPKIKVAATGPASISACGISEITFASGEIEFICGSITILVLGGSVDVEYLAEGLTVPVTATLSEGQELTFDPISLTLTVPEGTTATVMIGENTFTVTSDSPLTVDVAAPTITTQDLTVEADSPDGKIVDFTVTVVDDIDPNPTIECIPPSGSTFPLGDTTVDCTASDASSNESTGSFLVTVVDTTPPELTVPADVVAECTSPDTTLVDIGVATAVDLVDTSPSIVNDASGEFSFGSTPVLWTATDFTGNFASDTQTVTVEDTTPPSISAPANLQVVSNAEGGWTGDIGSASASDVCDPELDITSDAPETLPLGATTVTWTATDDSGNTSTVTQTITVLTKSQATQVLINDIKNFGLQKGTENSLTSKLDAAMKSFDKNNENSACGQLGSFVNEVNAQSGKKISQAQATQMFDLLKGILEVMNNCPKPLQSIG